MHAVQFSIIGTLVYCAINETCFKITFKFTCSTRIKRLMKGIKIAKSIPPNYHKNC